MVLIPRGRVVVTFLSVFWICLVSWFEYFRFSHDGKQCPWPDSKFLPSSDSTVKPYHILVIADPQILDHRSYPERGFFLSWITRLIVTINMRKNWWVAKSKKPDAVIFLGDLLDGGRFDMSDSEYKSYVGQFNRIFQLDSSIPKYYIPGNHDTGLGIVEWFSPDRYDRYKSYFGELNYEVHVANHTLVFIDAPGWADEEHKMTVAKKTFKDWDPLPGGAIEFINNWKRTDNEPTILLSHIPLYRPDGNGCGRLRERGRIRPGGGLGYQNTLGKDGSEKLLTTLFPTLILSGDDHDYCYYRHFVPSVPENPNPGSAKEISVKSFSIAMGIKRPGFQLLSLAPTPLRNPDHKYKPNDDVPCFLPDQLGIYIRIYLPVFVLTVALVCMTNLCCWRSKASRRRHRLTRSQDYESGKLSRSPERRSSYLPSPVSATMDRNVKSSDKPPVWPKLFFCFYPRGTGRRHNACLNCLLDIRDIAIYPLAIFVIISYWFS
ncbi:CDC1 [Coprinopsis cinerea okayama7|uniref:CDC1 n=1 Tax=Coprinopsis cinerea (strain Okayama-7 / 130 / ATCC MYA-4618 / FGSC 9003) TaxID=240176 RepID=A8N656_COPC7|nr:CDC1 [Coprinopsis cinerea okayama7\|eukprot:XP_001830336.1 CDC1 [Coprinopsis cinerea okayama7\